MSAGSFYEEEIRNLQRELVRARETIISLAPYEVQSLLHGFHQCATRGESRQWLNEIKTNVVNTSVPIDEDDFGRARAWCPLCRCGSSSPNEEGFALPVGMERHIAGFSRSFPRCPVMEAVFFVAHDYFNRKFSADEAVEREKEGAAIVRRRSVEPLYLVKLGAAPLLFEEGLYQPKLRSVEGLAWAAERLESLGFAATLVDRVRCSSLERHDLTVFADPRVDGEIIFRVYCRPFPKRGSATPAAQFEIKDQLKDGVAKRFAERVNKANTMLYRVSKGFIVPPSAAEAAKDGTPRYKESFAGSFDPQSKMAREFVWPKSAGAVESEVLAPSA